MAKRIVAVEVGAKAAEYIDAFGRMKTATRELGSEADKLAEKREAFNRVGSSALIMGSAISAAVLMSIKAAIGWESAWTGVLKTVDGTPEQLARVEDGLRDMTSEVSASHEEIAAVAEAAGQLGVSTENIVSFTRTMIDLGETTNLTSDEAATTLARFMNIMGTAQGQVSNLGSAVVGLGNNYATTEAEILAMSLRLAGAGKQIGLSEGDVLGLATALSSVGIEAEAGGSAFSKVMIDIAASVEANDDRLRMFADTAGVSADEFAAKWRSAPSEALALFVQGLANAESQGSSTLGILAELGITEVRMRDALLRSASASDVFTAAMQQGNSEFEANNALTAEAEKRYGTVEAKLKIAGNAVRDAAIDFGDVFLPAVAGSAEAVAGLADFLGGLPDPVQGLIAVLGGAAGVVLTVGGAALLAVPQIASFKVAMDTLGLSMKAFTLGGLGAVGALTALVAIVGAVAAEQAAARARAEAYADTLSAGTRKITDATRDLIAENVTASGSFLWLTTDSLATNAEKIGVSVETLTDAIAGNSAALNEVNAAVEQAIADGEKFGETNIEAHDAAVTLKQGLEQQIGALKDAADIARQKEEADKRATAEAEAHADALTDLTGAADDTTFAIDDTADAVRSLGDAMLDSRGSARDYYDALDELTSSLEENGNTLDITTEAGRSNEAAIDNIVQRTKEWSAAVLEQTGDQAQANQVVADGRQKLIEMLAQFGITGQAAEDYVNSLGLIPENVDTAVELNGIDTAEAELANLTRTRAVRVVVNATGAPSYLLNGPYASADGNLFDHQQQMIRAFANGGMETGIYPGRPGGLLKFAEEETKWEAFISGKPGQEERNRQITLDAAQRLGMSVGNTTNVTNNNWTMPVVAEPGVPITVQAVKLVRRLESRRVGR